MTVYLIHLARPFRNGSALCRHYVGYTRGVETVQARAERHRTGRGAKFMARVNEAGIAWDVVRIFPKGDRRREVEIKKAGARAFCPVCNGGSHGRSA